MRSDYGPGTGWTDNPDEPVPPGVEVLPELDEPPKDGVYRHLEDQPLTDDEAAAGNELGARIDVDNDFDNGGVT